ncbi:MAG: hypothetical protein EA397_17295 [Deltaproteobacteria bacterium]|nr:MAG: hypothetical protein EA397_17295 [Deltaproteobacteria bacterium]
MRHFAAHAVEGRLLFSTWEEGIHLWRRLLAAIPGTILCIMPDHLHVLGPARIQRKIQGAMSSHARWMNHRLGTKGRLWLPLSDTGEILGTQKVARNIRYVHLNPCRAGWVDDPLSWPLSTHRDLVGLALRPMAPTKRDPAQFHEYVSSDPSVSVQGSLLPYGSNQPPTLGAVIAAVSALSRCTDQDLRRRSAERTLLIRAARTFTDRTHAQIAAELDVGKRTVEGAGPLENVLATRIERVLMDRRFPLLRHTQGPLRTRRARRDRP